VINNNNNINKKDSFDSFFNDSEKENAYPSKISNNSISNKLSPVSQTQTPNLKRMDYTAQENTSNSRFSEYELDLLQETFNPKSISNSKTEISNNYFNNKNNLTNNNNLNKPKTE